MPDEVAAADTSTETIAAPSDGGGIKTASEVIEKVLGKAEEPAKAGKPEAKKEPTRRVEKLEAKAVEKAEAAPAPEDGAGALEKARYHLQHGDVAKFIELAAGTLDSKDMADGVREALARKLGVGSAQWEKLRQYEKGAKRAVAAREQELSTVVERLKSEFAPFHQARELYKSGDYDAAFKAAFGEDAADYQRKIITQRVGKNPEIEALKAQLAERDRVQAEREQRARDEAAQAEETRQVHQYLSETQANCRQSEDPAIRKYAERPAFIQRIYAIQREHYDAEANTTLPLAAAAEQARDEFRNVLQQWSVEESGALPAKAVQASALPVKPPAAKAPARALTQSRAAEASGKPSKETSAQTRERYQRMMEQSAD